MKYLPLFVSIAARSCLVVGGGSVAWRKAELLLRAGAVVTVVAPEIDAGLRTLVSAAGGRVIVRRFEAADVAGCMLVVAATNDPAVNAQVHAAAIAANVLINAVDDAARSSVIFPAIVDRDPITIAISTGGSSPTLATRLRGQIEALLHPRLGDLASWLSANRAKVRARLPDATARREFMRGIVEGPIAELVLQHRVAQADQRLLECLDALVRTGHTAATGFVSLVGAGPGDPDLLTLKGLRCLQRADLILYDNLVGHGVLDLARRDAKRTYVGKRAGLDGDRQSAINRLLVDEARAGLRVVRLKGGDPFVFGRGGEEIETLAAEGVDFEVVPGITAALGCAAYAGIPLTHRDCSQSVRFVTGHRRDDSVNLDWPELARPDQTLVFYMGLPGLTQICEQLIAHGIDRDTPVALISRGTLADQAVIVGSVATLPHIVGRTAVPGPTIIIVGHVVSLRERLQPQR
ncbi:MAG: uroporphyrinogen-III C-methyltransferase [Gammaproteobacteria bacterium]|nr:uroporphyrinogen-III C-methyltransferase [Gammaproteobacteria bacterium]